MLRLRTVLCALDLSPLSTRELDLAIELCEVLGARLILLHHRHDAAAAFAKAWEWQEVHQHEGVEARDAERAIAAAFARVGGRVPVEARLTTGSLTGALRLLAEAIPADLVVLGTHGAGTEDHASLAERAIDGSLAPVLVIHEIDRASGPLGLRRAPGERPLRVLVATDFSSSAAPAVDLAVGLARAVPVQLELLHVLAGDEAATPRVRPDGTVERPEDAAVARMRTALPADLAAAALVTTTRGVAGPAIADHAEHTGADLVVMGEHARGFLARFLTRDTARAVLARTRCPVLFVPPTWTQA